MRALVAGLPLLVACNLGGDVDLRDAGGGDAGDSRIDAASDGGLLGEPDGAVGLEGPGPLTFVVTSVEAVADRVCDVDGDGIADNAIANLGEPEASVLASSLASVLQMGLAQSNPFLVHFPLVDDRSTGTDSGAPFVVFVGLPAEVCAPGELPEGDEPSDFFPAAEPYCAKLTDLDGCGEPISPPGLALLDGGAVAAEAEAVSFGEAPRLTIRNVDVAGSIASGSGSAEMRFCGYSVAPDLGVEAGDFVGGGLTMLELLLAGGAPFGVSTLPGLALDVDVDGDGLERFETDSDNRIVRCIDGDGTTIEGRDCPQDERVADAISLTVRVAAVAAAFVGLQPDWDDRSCGVMLERADQCIFEPCSRWASDWTCPENRESLERLLECESRHCSDACTETDRTHCRACAEADCASELAACLEAAPCCPTPPEQSDWDPA